MYTNQIQQVNQTRQIAQQLINQTQQGNQQYRLMIQQEQQNIQMLEQILHREKQTVQLLEQSLRNHDLAINRCQEIVNIWNQTQNEFIPTNTIGTFGGQSVFRQSAYNQNQLQSQYNSHIPVHQ